MLPISSITMPPKARLLQDHGTVQPLFSPPPKTPHQVGTQLRALEALGLEAHLPRITLSEKNGTFCRECQRSFSSVSNFNKHRRDKHDRLRYSCRYCLRSSLGRPTKKYMKESIRISRAPRSCVGELGI